jgi:hypothetical protein
MHSREVQADDGTVARLLADSPCNWGRWGPDDEVGALNHLAPERVLAALSVVRSGRVFTLQIPMARPGGDPVWPGRAGTQRYNTIDMTTIGGLEKARVLPIAERGIVGRALLLDIARHRGKDSLDPPRRSTTRTCRRAPSAR